MSLSSKVLDQVGQESSKDIHNISLDNPITYNPKRLDNPLKSEQVVRNLIVSQFFQFLPMTDKTPAPSQA